MPRCIGIQKTHAGVTADKSYSIPSTPLSLSSTHTQTHTHTTADAKVGVTYIYTDLLQVSSLCWELYESDEHMLLVPLSGDSPPASESELRQNEKADVEPGGCMALITRN